MSAETVAELEQQLADLEAAEQTALTELDRARGALAQEREARQQRNAEATRNWWATVGVPAAKAARGRVTAALAAFREAVAGGDGTQVLTAYLAYTRAHAEAASFTRHAQAATTRTEGVGMDERTVSEVTAMSGWPEPFDRLLERAVRDAALDHGNTYTRQQLQPLRDQLEPS